MGVFIDFSKAFDSLDHSILIEKLSNVGIRGIPLSLFKSYLRNRKQYVVYKGKPSNWNSICTGVPQGSILGPILFLLYINDITNVSDKLKYVIFADDTNILMSHPNLQNLVHSLNIELSKIYNWICANKLALNNTKSHYIHFHRKPCDPNINKLSLGGKDVECTKTTKFLGVTIDDRLTWKEHIANITLKISKINGIIYRTRSLLTREALRSIYYSLVYPHLIYGVVVWGNASTVHKKQLIVMQKRIIRTIMFMRRQESTKDVFNELGLLTINHIYDYFATLFVFKSVHNLSPFQDYYDVIDHNYNTRGANLNMNLPLTQSSQHQRHIIFAGAVRWNALPDYIKKITNITSFKIN